MDGRVHGHRLGIRRVRRDRPLRIAGACGVDLLRRQPLDASTKRRYEPWRPGTDNLARRFRVAVDRGRRIRPRWLTGRAEPLPDRLLRRCLGVPAVRVWDCRMGIRRRGFVLATGGYRGGGLGRRRGRLTRAGRVRGINRGRSGG